MEFIRRRRIENEKNTAWNTQGLMSQLPLPDPSTLLLFPDVYQRRPCQIGSDTPCAILKLQSLSCQCWMALTTHQPLPSTNRLMRKREKDPQRGTPRAE